MTRFDFAVRWFLWVCVVSAWIVGCAGCTGCGGDESSGLDVIVRTDLVAGFEFRRVLVEAEPESGDAPGAESLGAARGEPWRTGAEVTSIRGLSGAATIRVTLQDAARSAIVSREVRVADASRGRVVVVIARSCIGVSCGDGESCHGGVCADSACHPDAPERCPAPACTDGDASGCAPAMFACATAECAAGVCFNAALTREECSSRGTCCTRDEWCDPTRGCSEVPDGPEAGVVDGGPDADMDVGADGGTDMTVDAEACVDGARCTPSGFEWQCYADGRIDCARGGACIGLPGSEREIGASCGASFSGRVCNAEHECVDCFDDGEACVRNGSCQLGVRTAASGCECVEDDEGAFAEAGTKCGTNASGVGMYCTVDAQCRACSDEGTSCTRAEGPCMRGVRSCAFDSFMGTATCAEAGLRPTGSICSRGSGDGLCDGASPLCNACEEGLACLSSSSGNAACVYGATMCDTGSGGGVMCDGSGSTNYVAAGTACGTNAVCTGSGSCLACTQDALCAPERACAVSRVDCSGGAAECVRESLLASGTTGREGASEMCASTETCNGLDDECQPVMSNVLSVGVGPTHSCAVVANEAAPITRTNLSGVTSSVYCWGSNTLSALGINSVAQCNAGRAAIVDLCDDNPGVPGTLCRSSAASSNPREVVVGHSTSCFIAETGAVYCWGNNLNGEVGGVAGTLDGDGVAYPACSGMRDATPQQDLQCAVRSPRKVPLPLASGDKVVQLAISPAAPVNCTPTGYANSSSCTPPTGPQYRKVCAVTEQGKLYCWGGVRASSLSSEMGISAMMPSAAQEPDLYRPNAAWRFEQVAIGESHWCVLLRDTSATSMTRGQSRVVCAGAYDRGQRGDGLARAGSGESPAFPPPSGNMRSVVGLTDAVDIAAAGRFACAVRANTTEGRGRVVCWGDFGGLSVDSGERADGVVRTPVYVRAKAGAVVEINAPSLPSDPAALVTGATSVDASETAVCVQLSSGGVACWGKSNLGIGTPGPSLHAVLLPSDPATDVFPSRPRTTVALASQSGAGGSTVGCFVRHHDRRQLFCWGANGTRQLGHCRSTPSETRLTPVPVLPFDVALNGICRAGESLSPCVYVDP